MKMIICAAAMAGLIFLGGCKSTDTSSQTQTQSVAAEPPQTQPQPMKTMTLEAHPAASPLASVTTAVANVLPLGNSGVHGKVTFTETADGVMVVADISGLTPGLHGFHIHEWGDASDWEKGMSAGGHYNPEHEMHGLPTSAHHHPGDMGNLDAGPDGHAHLTLLLPGVTIAGEKDPILGRSVIIHVKADDGSQPVGNAGGRVAIGIIGVAKPG